MKMVVFFEFKKRSPADPADSVALRDYLPELDQIIFSQIAVYGNDTVSVIYFNCDTQPVIFVYARHCSGCACTDGRSGWSCDIDAAVSHVLIESFVIYRHIHGIIHDDIAGNGNNK